MKPQFIQIGNRCLNLNAIGYIASVAGGIRIVTTIARSEGKTFSILLRDKDARKVMEAIRPFIVAKIEIEGR